MARSLVGAGIDVTVATTDDDGPGRRLAHGCEGAEGDASCGYRVFHFPKQTEFYKVSLPFRAWVRRHAGDYDVIHIHALFSFTSVVAARAARRAGVPYVIRPLGVLNQWGMRNRRRWLKALSFRFIEKPILRHAAVVHFTSDAERIEAESAGAAGPAVVIPLGIDTAAFHQLPPPDEFLQTFPQAAGRAIVLFLSRIDPKKGLEPLLAGFTVVHRRFPDALLVIGGAGDESYTRRLHSLADSLGIAEHVVWAGFVQGTLKMSALAAARVFVLPSHSENFGIALVEGLAAGLPCVTSPGVAISAEIHAGGAGLVALPQPDALADAIGYLLDDKESAARMAARARLLAEERFSLAAMGASLAALYRRITAAR